MQLMVGKGMEWMHHGEHVDDTSILAQWFLTEEVGDGIKLGIPGRGTRG